MELSQEESGHGIISQGSQANKGGKQGPDRICGGGCRLGDGCTGEMTLLPSFPMPVLSRAQASLPDARSPAPIYQVSVGIHGLVS